MKTSLLNFVKAGLLMAAILLITQTANSATFTAVASGDWSSSATWGGTAPSSSVTTDQITIPSSITVNLDNNTTINGALSSLNVAGTLTSNSNVTLTLGVGTLLGAGTMAVDELVLNAGTVVSFTGQIAVNTFTYAAGSISVAADILVNETFNLASGTLDLASGATIDVGADADIVISGGSFITSGSGTMGLTGSYNVIYTTTYTTGIELDGAGLNDVEIDAGSGNSVTLSDDLDVSGTLTLTSGTLVLSSNDLRVSGDLENSGYGYISSTSGSNLTIDVTGGTTGSIWFSGNSNTVNNFTVNVGSGNQASFGGTLTVAGALTLTSGNLDFDEGHLIIDGTLSGSGMLSGSSSSNLDVTSSGGLSGSLVFASGGQTVGDVDINVGTDNSVTLGSSLTISGELSLSGGSNLNISGQSLTIGSGGDISGSGSLIANSSSSLTVNATGGTSSGISISGGSIGTLHINTGGTGNVSLDNDLMVSGTLNLESGSFVLNGYNLDITGAITAGGSGTITSSNTSDISVSGSASPSGSLMFAAGGNSVNDFTVNIGSNGYVMIGSDLWVDGDLTFTDGSIHIGDNTLDIGASGTITGASSSSYVITGADGHLGIQVTAGGSGWVNFPVGTDDDYFPANIALNSGSSSGRVDVGVRTDVYAQGETGADISDDQPVVDATWDVESDISSNLDLDMELWWEASSEVNSFMSSSAYISHYMSGSWDVVATASATAEGSGWFSIERNNITSLSPFAVFDANTVTGVNEVAENAHFSVYPNPANDNISVQNLDVTSGVVFVDVMSVTGQVLQTTSLNTSNATVSLDGLSSGNYFIRMYNEQMSEVQKIVKL